MITAENLDNLLDHVQDSAVSQGLLVISRLTTTRIPGIVGVVMVSEQQHERSLAAADPSPGASL